MPYPVESLLEVNEDMTDVLLGLKVPLTDSPEIEYQLCSAALSCFYIGVISGVGLFKMTFTTILQS